MNRSSELHNTSGNGSAGRNSISLPMASSDHSSSSQHGHGHGVGVGEQPQSQPQSQSLHEFNHTVDSGPLSLNSNAGTYVPPTAYLPNAPSNQSNHSTN